MFKLFYLVLTGTTNLGLNGRESNGNKEEFHFKEVP